MSYIHSKNNVVNAKELRKNMTEEERKLWYLYLKREPIKWRRQEMIGNYIIDFYCNDVKLAIELDGGQHTEDVAVEYDRKRTEYLNSLGIEVIRFYNFEINKNFSGVCDNIDIKVRGRRKPPSVVINHDSFPGWEAEG